MFYLQRSQTSESFDQQEWGAETCRLWFGPGLRDPCQMLQCRGKSVCGHHLHMMCHAPWCRWSRSGIGPLTSCSGPSSTPPASTCGAPAASSPSSPTPAVLSSQAATWMTRFFDYLFFWCFLWHFCLDQAGFQAAWNPKWRLVARHDKLARLQTISALSSQPRVLPSK